MTRPAMRLPLRLALAALMLPAIASAKIEACEDGTRIGIAVVLPLSKGDAIYGIPNWNGILAGLASSELGSDRHCRIDVWRFNDEGSPRLAEQAAEQIIASDALAVLGSGASSTTKALIQKTSRKIVVISAQASDDDLRSPWFFRTTIPNMRLAKLAVGNLRDVLMRERLDVGDANGAQTFLMHDGTDFGKNLLADIDKELSRLSIPTDDVPFEAGRSSSAVARLPDDAKAVFIIASEDGDASDILQAIQKQAARLENLKTRVVFEINPAIADTDAFNDAYMYTSYNPADKARLGVSEFQANFRSFYGVNRRSRRVSEKAGAIHVHDQTLPGQEHWEVPASTSSAPDLAAPSYAAALGYDQAGVLMNALSELLKSSEAGRLKSASRNAIVRDYVENMPFQGALATYVFNPEFHDSAAVPVLVQRKAVVPDPAADAWLAKKFRPSSAWSRWTLSLSGGESRVTSGADTSSINGEARLTYSDPLTSFLNYEVSPFINGERDAQSGVTTKTEAIGADVLRFSGEIKGYGKVYASGLGFGASRIQTSNSPDVSGFGLVFRAGTSIPLSSFTQLLSMTFEWERKTTMHGVSGPSLTTFKTNLSLTFSPSQLPGFGK